MVGKCCKDRLSTSKDTKSGLKTYVTVPHFNSYAFLVVSDVSVWDVYSASLLHSCYRGRLVAFSTVEKRFNQKRRRSSHAYYMPPFCPCQFDWQRRRRVAWLRTAVSGSFLWTIGILPVQTLGYTRLTKVFCMHGSQKVSVNRNFIGGWVFFIGHSTFIDSLIKLYLRALTTEFEGYTLWVLICHQHFPRLKWVWHKNCYFVSYS